MSDTLVLGLGNPLMGDDGLGPAVIARLSAEWSFPDDVSLVDGGTAGLRLLPLIEGATRVLFVDAIDANRPVGEPVALAGDDLPRHVALRLSPHDVDLRDVLALAELRGTRPAEMRALGLQPDRIAVGIGLSTEVQDGLPGLVRGVVHQLIAWGHDVRCMS